MLNIRFNKKDLPIRPINAVSTKEAIGSAVKASAAGKAIDAISTPSLSNLRADLLKQKTITML